MAHPPSLPGAVHDTVAEALWLATALTPNHRALARTRPRIVCSIRWSLVVEHLIRTARFSEEASGRCLMAAVEQVLDPPAAVDAESAPALADDARRWEAGRSPTSLVGRVRAWLPEGGSLPEDAWWRRHRVLLVIIALHAPAIVIYAVVRGYGFRHGLVEVSVVAAFGLL